MKTTIKNILLSTAMAATTFSFNACSLDEVNPGGFTMDNLATSEETYAALVNQTVFGMERHLYGTEFFMMFSEGDTDLWTYCANQNTSYTQYFWFDAGAAPSISHTQNMWNAIYDGIGACNIAISKAGKVPFKTEAERNKQVAFARFMRAMYYFNAVEQFGAVTVITEPATQTVYNPTRTEPLQVYKDVILPDFEFAVEWLDKGTDATCTTPTKKAALGMLAKAYLQTKEYGTDEYQQKALETAKLLIADCEAGGATYGAYMYPTFAEVFDKANNWENKEALWKHRWYAGSDGHGSSNGNWKCNRMDEDFQCKLSQFGAWQKTEDAILSYEYDAEGYFMPTQHLLNLFVQDDGTLDPRFHMSFTTEWKGNKSLTWDASTQANFNKDASVVGQTLNAGDLAYKIVMPQDADYATEVAKKATAPYLIVDYRDVYDDANRNVKMTLNGKENLFRYIYPSLRKHLSDNYYVANASKNRNGNLNATFMMRMSEVYLIAAEASLYLNNGQQAMSYVNKVRARAGANPLTVAPTVRTIIDERGRELCGEYCRFYDLKRVGMMTQAYLNETHPDLGQYFKPEYAVRPIPQQFIQAISNGAEYQNPGY
jgi:hypothetical protein